METTDKNQNIQDQEAVRLTKARRVMYACRPMLHGISSRPHDLPGALWKIHPRAFIE